MSETLNNFFKNAVESLKIEGNSFLLENTGDLSNPVEIAIKKFEHHPSILNIKDNISSSSSFTFTQVTFSDIEKEIKSLNPKKASTFQNIPIKHLKETSNICSESLVNIWNNEVISKNLFPSELKLADITPIFKKGDATLAKNYRPVSVLPVISKVYVRLMQKQLISYIDQYLSPYLCGYRKGYNAQHTLVLLLEKWKASLDKHGYAGAILMSLSKAFDTINHELLIAKLHAYGLDKNALTIMLSYLSYLWQRTKINTSFSSWSELLERVPQGSV